MRVYVPIVQLILEIVGDLLQVHLPSIVDVLVRRPGTGNADTILLRPGVVRTEALQPELPGHLRWVQMEQRWNQINLPEVVVVRFSGKPEQDIPRHRDM